MDMNALLNLLTLSEKLQGHPRLAGMKTLVDHEIDKMHNDSIKEVEKLAADKKAARAKEEADRAAILRGDTVQQQAVGAHARVDLTEAEKKQAEIDAKTITEADKLDKAYQAMTPEAKAKYDEDRRVKATGGAVEPELPFRGPSIYQPEPGVLPVVPGPIYPANSGPIESDTSARRF